MKEYAEVKCDYNNEEGFWCVDAWMTDDPNEAGQVIAAIEENTGNVFYIDSIARVSTKAKEVIEAKQKEIKELNNI